MDELLGEVRRGHPAVSLGVRFWDLGIRLISYRSKTVESAPCAMFKWLMLRSAHLQFEDESALARCFRAAAEPKFSWQDFAVAQLVLKMQEACENQ